MSELTEEKNQVAIRRNALLAVPEKDHLIYSQCNVMTLYLVILKDRIDNAHDARNSGVE